MPAINEILAQIEAPTFSAGIVLFDDKVVEAAPIVGYMKRKKFTRQQVRDYCDERGWKISIVWQMERPDITAPHTPRKR